MTKMVGVTGGGGVNFWASENLSGRVHFEGYSPKWRVLSKLSVQPCDLLCWSGYLNSIMILVLTSLVNMFTFLKGFLMTVTTATVDYIKLILLIRAAVYVVIISS